MVGQCNHGNMMQHPNAKNGFFLIGLKDCGKVILNGKRYGGVKGCKNRY